MIVLVDLEKNLNETGEYEVIFVNEGKYLRIVINQYFPYVSLYIIDNLLKKYIQFNSLP